MIGRLLGKLVKRLVILLALGMVGTVLGWCVVVVITEVPLWVLIVMIMVAGVTLLLFARWYIKEQD